MCMPSGLCGMDYIDVGVCAYKWVHVCTVYVYMCDDEILISEVFQHLCSHLFSLFGSLLLTADAFFCVPEIEKEADSKKDKTAESKTDEHKVTTDELWDLYLKVCVFKYLSGFA